MKKTKKAKIDDILLGNYRGVKVKVEYEYDTLYEKIRIEQCVIPAREIIFDRLRFYFPDELRHPMYFASVKKDNPDVWTLDTGETRKDEDM